MASHVCEHKLVFYNPSSGEDLSNKLSHVSQTPTLLKAWMILFTMPTALPHPIDMFSTMTTFSTSMEYINMFISALLWLYAAYHSWIFLQHQETASTLINYIIVCGEYLKYGRSWTPPGSCIILRPHHSCASDVASGTHVASDSSVSVPYCSVVQTPEDVLTFSNDSKEEYDAATTTTTEATNKSL